MAPKIYTFFTLARILATGGIFTFHYLELTGHYSANLDIYSIMVFCFLTRYFSSGSSVRPLNWLCKRLFTIMIPYWVVIVPALFINAAIQYKQTSLLMDTITLFGGNLFLNNPVYVIAWYITFVNLLYFFIYLMNLADRQVFKVFFGGLGYFCFGFLLNLPYYFLSFLMGILCSKILPPKSKDTLREGSLNNLIYYIQDRCYAFFLIHGGVLLFFTVKMNMSGLALFITAFATSVFGALVLQWITTPLLSHAVSKTILVPTTAEGHIGDA